MRRNIEVKFQTESLEEGERMADEIGASFQAELTQIDTYFETPSGRLKLRQFPGNPSQLIYYERPDSERSRLSRYDVAEIFDTENFLKIAEKIFRTEAVVRKTRRLYLFGNTRIHFDRVEDLGNFIELETVLEEVIPQEHAQEEHDYVLDSLGLCEKIPVSRSYRELAMRPPA